jgi:aminoglycoside 6-adenylyltransferase
MKADNMSQAYEQLIDRFAQWAQKEHNIRAVLVVGSRARVDHPADQWSDLDLLIVANDPPMFLEDTDWISKIGIPWLTFLESTGDGNRMERRVLFEGGLDVDLTPISTAQVMLMVSGPLPPDAADVLRRGTRLLIDKDDLGRQLLVQDLGSQRFLPPAQREYLENVNDFWYHAVWTAKHLRRGELWWAKSGCDSHMKSLLRRMMEWHAQAHQEGEIDTWLRGRFMEEWADPRAVDELKSAFSHYDLEDTWRALFATMNLYRWLAVETTQKLGFIYPAYGDQMATDLVNQLFLERP